MSKKKVYPSLGVKDGYIAKPLTKQGLPWQAFAIVGDKNDPDTWLLPHHTKAIYRTIHGTLSIEDTVDWEMLAYAASSFNKQPIAASPEEILEAASHLANHFRASGLPLPDSLAVLV